MNYKTTALDGGVNQDTMDERRIIKKVAFRLMPLIIICYFFAFFDRINVSFAKFQLQDALNLSDTAYGFGAGLFVVGYVLFEVPSNLFLYKVGARRWIARIMISWGITTCLMMFVQTEWQFYLLRFLIGAMEAGFAPGILYYLTVWFPSSFRGRVTSILFLASAFSGLVGAPLSGVVLGRLDGALGLEGWHWLFLLGGLPCIFLGVLVLKCLTDRPAEAKWLTDEEKLFLSARITHQNRHAHGHSLLAALKMPGFILLGFIYFLIQTASYGMNFWVPQLIRSTGILNPEILGLLSAIPYLCGAITMLLIGRFSDATGERRYFLAGLVFLTGTGFVCAGIFDNNTVMLVLSLAILGAGVLGAVPTFWTMPAKLLSGAGAAGGIAVINTLGQLGGIVSPVMVGSIKDYTGSTTPALYTIATLCLLCFLILLFGLPEHLRRKDDREIRQSN